MGTQVRPCTRATIATANRRLPRCAQRRDEGAGPRAPDRAVLVRPLLGARGGGPRCRDGAVRWQPVVRYSEPPFARRPG